MVMGGDSVSMGRTVLEVGTENRALNRGMEEARATVTRQMEAMGRVNAETMRGIQQAAARTSDAWFRQRDAALASQRDINQSLGVHQQQVKSAADSWRVFEEAAERANQRAIEGLRQQGEALTMVGVRMAAAGAAATAPAGLAVASAIGFETSMARVEKTSGLTGAALAALGQEFRDLATQELPMSASALADVGAMAAQMGVEAENIAIFTETVAKLATATDIVGDEGAAALARFMEVMGDSQGNVDRVSSAMVELGNNTAATESEILEMAQRLAAAGRQVGLTTGEVLGLAAAMRNLGIPAEMGGTAMSRVILAIYSAAQSGASGLTDFAAAAGMTSEAFYDLLQSDPSAAIAQFVGGLGQAEAQGQNIIAVLEDLEFGNVRVRDTLLRLTNSQELMTSRMQMGSEAYRENIALQEEFEVFQRTTAAQIELTKNRITELAITTGTVLLPAANAMLVLLQDVLDVFMMIPAPVQGIVVGLTAVAGVMAIAGGVALVMAGQFLQVRVAMMQLGLSASSLIPFLGPLGVAGAIVAVGVAADGVLRLTTGHGIVDWLFRDPKTAEVAAAAVSKFRDELQKLNIEFNSAAGIQKAREQLDEWTEAYRRAREEVYANPLFGGEREFGGLRAMKEAKASIVELVEAAVAAGVPFEDLHRIVSTLDDELADAARNVIPDYQGQLDALNASLFASEQQALGASRGFDETTAALYNARAEAAAFAAQLDALNPRMRAIGFAKNIMQAGLERGGGMYQEILGYYRGLVQDELAMQRDLEGIVSDLMGPSLGPVAIPSVARAARTSAGGVRSGRGGSGGGAGGGGAERTPIEQATDAFRDFGERAPRALKAARKELDLYREAARKAGDDTAVGLIDRMLDLDPTVSQVQGAVRSLQAQYGDLAAEAQRAGDIVQQAAQIAADAWRQITDNARQDIERLGGVVVTALRRQLEEELATTLRGLDRQREARRRAHDEQLADLVRARDARIRVLQGELDALSQAATDDQMAEIERQIGLAWDPRERARLEQQRVDLMRRIRADEIRGEMAAVEEQHRQREAALRESLDRQLSEVDALERATREGFERSTQTFALEARARELIMAGNLEAIGALIEQHVPEWASSWQSFADSVIEGPLTDLEHKVRSVIALMRTVTDGAPGGGGIAGPSAAMQAAIDQMARAKAAGGVGALRLPGLREMFEQQFGMPAPLAAGGIITRPTFALLGETAKARPEIVTPEHLMRRIVREETGGGGGQVIEVHTHTYLDGRHIDERIERVTAQAVGRGRYGA